MPNLVNIGNTTALDLASSGDQGLNVAALKITVPNNGVYRLVSMSMIVTTAGGASLRLGMYDDTGTQTFWPTGGAPGNLLAETGAVALVDGLNTLPVTPKIITAGGRWINYNQSANVIWTQHDTHVQGNSLFYVAPFAAFDNPFTPGSANDSAVYPVYATFDFTPSNVQLGGPGKAKGRRERRIGYGKTLKHADWSAYVDYRDAVKQIRAKAKKSAEPKIELPPALKVVAEVAKPRIEPAVPEAVWRGEIAANEKQLSALKQHLTQMRQKLHQEYVSKLETDHALLKDEAAQLRDRVAQLEDDAEALTLLLH